MNQDATNYLEPIHRIIFPSFIFAIKHIIKIKPHTKLFIQFKFRAKD